MIEETAQKCIREIRRFNRYYTNLLGLLNRHRLDSPYSLAEARVLLEIGQMENCTASYLKDLLKMDFGYLSRIIRSLIREQAIAEEPSPRDGRSRFYSLTEKGRTALKGIDELSGQQVAGMIRELSETDRAELVRHMQAIEDILNHKAGIR